MLLIRKVAESDKRDLWAWRNDPASVAASISADPVPWPAHSAWFERILTAANTALYIGEVDGDKIGMCRFDLDATGLTAEVSINLNPAHRGKRLSPSLLANSIQSFWDEHGALPLTARIRVDNAASTRLFTAAGFRQTGEEGDFRTYRLGSAE